MSYILDALRKSEAARRSREAPDLLGQTAAPLQPAPARHAPKYAGRPAWAVAAVGVAALAVALWLRFAPTGEAPAHASDGSRADTTQPAGTAADASDTLGNDTLDGDALDRMPAERMEAGPITQDAPSLDPGRPPGVIPGMAPVAIPAPAAPTPAPQQPAPIARAPKDPPPAPAAGADTAGPSAPTRVASPTAPSAATPTTLAPRPGAVSFSPLPLADGRPVALADIAPEQRRQLPPLRMSMHLWNEAPERRLLVLDGQRLRQGDVIGEVVVERIDRDGAVLAWRGARILLPTE